jgi:hypothetical protein
MKQLYEHSLSQGLQGDDHPQFVPMKPPPLVKMTVEESVHYSLDGTEAESEWIADSPWGAGAYRLGDWNREFFVEMFHQLHCMRRMRAYYSSGSDEAGITHIEHCLNLLRQAILCHADTTLERGDFMKANFTEQRLGTEYVCRDWQAVYDVVDINYLRWHQWLAKNNITSTYFRTR